MPKRVLLEIDCLSAYWIPLFLISHQSNKQLPKEGVGSLSDSHDCRVSLASHDMRTALTRHEVPVDLLEQPLVLFLGPLRLGLFQRLKRLELFRILTIIEGEVLFGLWHVGQCDCTRSRRL